MTFGDEVTRARKRHKLSKHDLAHETGLSYQHIHNVEVGHRRLTLEVFRKLDKRLKFPFRVLIAFLREDSPRCDRQQLAGLLLLALGLL